MKQNQVLVYPLSNSTSLLVIEVRFGFVEFRAQTTDSHITFTEIENKLKLYSIIYQIRKFVGEDVRRILQLVAAGQRHGVDVQAEHSGL